MDEQRKQSDAEPSAENPSSPAQGSIASGCDPVQLLTSGLLTQFEQPVAQITDRLAELSVQQVDLADATAAECEKFVRTKDASTTDLPTMISTSQKYVTKLSNCKRDMVMLSERVKEMKARSLRLQEAKQREALRRELERQKEVEREEQLLARPAAN